MNLNDITFTQGIFSKINYDFEPIILFDNTSIDGVARHISLLKIDGELQFRQTFTFDIVNVSETESNSLEDIDGSNEVTFQPYDNTDVYTCNCSSNPFFYSENGQDITSFNIVLTVKSTNEPIPVNDYLFYFPFTNGSLLDFSGNDQIINDFNTLVVDGVKGGDTNGGRAFDGLTSYMSTAVQRLDYPEFTLTMWVNTDGSTNDRNVFEWADSPTSPIPFLATKYTAPNIRFYYQSGYQYQTTLPIGSWVFIAIRRSQLAGSWRITVNETDYLDLKGVSLNGDNIYFGRGFDGYMSTDLDNIRFYDRSISDEELTEIYNFEKP